MISWLFCSFPLIIKSKLCLIIFWNTDRRNFDSRQKPSSKPKKNNYCSTSSVNIYLLKKLWQFFEKSFNPWKKIITSSLLRTKLHIYHRQYKKNHQALLQLSLQKKKESQRIPKFDHAKFRLINFRYY